MPGEHPRTRVGCDLGLPRLYSTGLGFNPRTRMGCDDSIQKIRRFTWAFEPGSANLSEKLVLLGLCPSNKHCYPS